MMRIATAMRSGVTPRMERSEQMRRDPKTKDHDGEENEQEPAKIFVEQILDRLAIIFEDQRQREKARPPRHETQKNEERHIIGQKSAGDRDELEGDGGQTFYQNDRPAPLGVQLAHFVDAGAIAVKVDQPFTDRLKQKRADGVAEERACDGAERADQSKSPGLFRPRDRHRNQNRIRRHRKKRTFSEGDQAERRRSMAALREGQRPPIELLEHVSLAGKRRARKNRGWREESARGAAPGLTSLRRKCPEGGRPGRRPAGSRPRPGAVLGKAGRSMKLYDSASSPNPRRVRIFIAEKGLEVERVR